MPMKRRPLILGVIIVLAAATLSWYLLHRTESASFATPTALDGSGLTLGVEDLMRHTENCSGSVRVKGVVSSVAPDQQMLSLIDMKEWDECGVVSCAALTLPVHWTGDLPTVRDIVIIAGTVGNSDGKLVFVAQAVEKVPPTKGQPS